MWGYLFALLFVPSFLSYFVHHLICAVFYKTQNLKKRYNADWALVTGGSSGIGKSIATRLARQGLNVVLVALGDELLDKTFDELKAAYPKCQFRKVPVNLGGNEYLEPIVAATRDIKIQILFCNAGYMLTGFFHTRPLDALMANLNCNAVSAVQVTHHFVKQMDTQYQPLRDIFVTWSKRFEPGPFWRSLGSNRLLQIVDYNFLATTIATFGRYMPDFKRAAADGEAPGQAAPAKKAQ
ncbi:3-ketoacyl-CoA reductase [Tetrabaena socialis]|uniref:3-ketoacyl-CoA reductase n=1 Tax=Tetrabaena socialis TaxID=47790 RepID=A0A2J8A834_9CHLO|nr:3-ketoacyl-CoA reductase [Tetrabaena socialis]|eukprot:PNH08633.1 3-ketoacyl-CoA reductase [Tetrabaena socialis]